MFKECWVSHHNLISWHGNTVVTSTTQGGPSFSGSSLKVIVTVVVEDPGGPEHLIAAPMSRPRFANAARATAHWEWLQDPT